MLTKVMLVVLVVLAVFAATAVFGLVWAIRRGHVQDFQRGATSIFDDEEPMGEVSDRFPDMKGDDEANA